MSQTQTMNYVFDAAQHEPSAGQQAIPAGTYNLEVCSAEIADIQNGQTFKVGSKVMDGQFAGTVLYKRYNLWNKASAENSRISHNELSALCHVTGIFKIDMSNGGKALIGGRYQGTVTNDGQYNEIKGVADVNGNKPNKAGTGYAPAQTAPVASATPGGWGVQPAAAPVPAAVPPAAAPIAAPAAAFPPAGWTAHPDAPGYFYQGQEVLTEAQLRERVAASTAPATPSAPPSAPTTGSGWGSPAASPAVAASPAAAPWGAPAA